MVLVPAAGFIKGVYQQVESQIQDESQVGALLDGHDEVLEFQS